MAKASALTKPQYVTNEHGKKTAVILPIDDYHRLLEDIQDLVTTAERKDEPLISHKKVVGRLKKNGYL